MKKSRMYVANWKMNMQLGDAIDFASQCNKFLTKKENSKKKIILCPSFPAIAPLACIIEKEAIGLGAQNCSEHQVGAYTGEVSAQSLKEAGCNYCIVGHSERRHYFQETNETIARKVTKLLDAAIDPIICIGETVLEFNQNKTLEVLQSQLDPILNALNISTHSLECIYIAYEPVWAIGTGKIPDDTTVEKIFTWLVTFVKKRNSKKGNHRSSLWRECR